VPFPVKTSTPDFAASSSPKVKAIYLNGKRYEPEWQYSYPFTNLYFNADGKSPLRFIVEVDQTAARWQIVISPHIEDSASTSKPTFVLNNLETIHCESRVALQVETSMEEIQAKLGNHRVFDY
jgi:hypothetical protein